MNFGKVCLIPILSILLLANLVAGLSCYKQSATEAVENSDAIFSGKVIATDSVANTATFEVYEVWKGVSHKFIVVKNNGWDVFAQGEEYLVFAWDDNGQLVDIQCGRTSGLEYVEEDIKAELGPGNPPEINNLPPLNSIFSIEIVIILVIVIIISGILILRYKQKIFK